MKIFQSLIMLVITGLLAACFDQKAEDILRQTPKGGWITYWDFSNGVSALELSPGIFNDVMFFVAHLNTNGHIVLHESMNPEQMKAFIGAMRLRNVRSWLTVVNDVVDESSDQVILKDSVMVEQLLSSSNLRTAHIQELLTMAADYGFTGIDIDYENLKPELRDMFSGFVAELATQSHNAELTLSVTVQPKNQEKNSIGAGTMDYKALCSKADRVQIMLYNEHSGRTEPGPMATPDWIKAILDYAVNQCPREKLVSVLKVSGMVWGNDNVRGIQYDEAINLIQQHKVAVEIDPRGQTPFFKYTEDGTEYTAYYENAASLMTKLDGILKYRLGGVVFWSLGRHDPVLLNQLAGIQR